MATETDTDRYDEAVASTPIYCGVLADLGERWADDPMPHPEMTNGDLLQHLWNLGGEYHYAHATEKTVGYPPEDAVVVWRGGKPGHVMTVAGGPAEPPEDDDA